MAKAKKVKREPVTMSVEDAVSSACTDLTDLGQELRDWYDNLPENLQNGDKGSTLDEGASALESISEPSIPDALVAEAEGLGAVTVPHLRPRASRSARRDNAVCLLETSKQLIEDFLAEKPDDYAASSRDEMEQFVSEIEDVIGESENVEFPGMYG